MLFSWSHLILPDGCFNYNSVLHSFIYTFMTLNSDGDSMFNLLFDVSAELIKSREHILD